MTNQEQWLLVTFSALHGAIDANHGGGAQAYALSSEEAAALNALRDYARSLGADKHPQITRYMGGQ